jgi:hypothetical protein
MAWRLRLVGACVLAVLALLPAAATLCAALCQPPAASSASHHHHHHDAAPAAVDGAPATGVVLNALPHDCGTHETALQPSLAERASWESSLTAMPPRAEGLLGVPVIADGSSRHATSPSPPPTSTTLPLALRI